MKNMIPIITATAAVIILLAGLIIYNYTHQTNPEDLMVDQYAYLFEEPDEYFDEVIISPAASIQSSVKQMKISLNLPKDQKFNNQAPFTLAVKSEDASIVKIGKYNIPHATKIINIPVELIRGSTTISVILDFSYCGMKDQSLCFFKKVKLVYPVNITPDGTDKFEITYTIAE